MCETGWSCASCVSRLHLHWTSRRYVQNVWTWPLRTRFLSQSAIAVHDINTVFGLVLPPYANGNSCWNTRIMRKFVWVLSNSDKAKTYCSIMRWWVFPCFKARFHRCWFTRRMPDKMWGELGRQKCPFFLIDQKVCLSCSFFLFFSCSTSLLTLSSSMIVSCDISKLHAVYSKKSCTIIASANAVMKFVSSPWSICKKNQPRVFINSSHARA